VGRGMAQIMYTHVSKCKNDKINEIIKEIDQPRPKNIFDLFLH
jgi:hypothetical protein